MTAKRYIPHVGDIVIVHSPTVKSNGTQTCAAIVTQTFNAYEDNLPTLLNLTVFPPFMVPQYLGSVEFHESVPKITSDDFHGCWRHNDHHTRVGEVEPAYSPAADAAEA